jgi:hypothetical protein
MVYFSKSQNPSLNLLADKKLKSKIFPIVFGPEAGAMVVNGRKGEKSLGTVSSTNWTMHLS